jgi:ADP-heptose:LPS heptosyltransferase
VIAELRRQKIDAMIDLSLGWQTGFMAALAGIRTRAGFNFKGRGRFLTKNLPLDGFHTKPVSEYYLDLLPLLGFRQPEKRRYDFALPPEPLVEADRFLEGKELGRGTPVAGLVPGGGASWGPNAVFKQWPPDRFAEAADAIAQRRGMKVLLFGDAKERPLCEEVASRMKSVAVLATGLPLLTVAGLLKRCSVVVGNDGGLIHLAAAQGIRTVAIFGPVDAAVYGPMPAAAHRTVGKGLDCQPCYHGFRFPPCPIDNACLKTLEVAQVTSAVEALERAK